MKRSRVACLLACAATIALGLLSRRYPTALPESLGKYPGDALWTLMVFWALGFLLPSMASLRVAALALGISFAIEFLKLWQLPWLVEARQTTIGHLVFGHVFSWQNLVAYAVGAGVGWAIESVTTARTPSA